MSDISHGIAAPAGGDLPGLLRRAHGLVAPLAAASAAAGRAGDRLERDLLPRTAGGEAYIVAGIVGPNNAGKSALFNALVGRTVSPSIPSGGATRRLVGAAHPALLERLRNAPTLARFPLRALDGSAAGTAEILAGTGNPAELLVTAEAALPPGLLLIDTPDFDSILEDNRLASESLLAVADLVITVVTRHSYQNRDVVRFLERWLAFERPWVLVYNEAPDTGVVESHAAKLTADVGTPPLAIFQAPHSLAVQQGASPLEPRQVLPPGPAAPAPGPLLREVLFDIDRIADVKSRSFAASLLHLRSDVSEAATELAAGAAAARAILDAGEARAREAGEQVAAAAMPIGPFIDSFRVVLDRRSNPLSRGWRASVRRLRLSVEQAVSAFRPKGSAPAVVSISPGGRAAVEIQQLRRVWPGFWEELVRDLGREARHAARQGGRSEFGALLEADLADDRVAAALRGAEESLARHPGDLEGFQHACEALVDNALEERGFDLDIQAAADVATLAPLAIAAAVIVKTGGMGADIAIAGGGAVSTFLAEKYTHLLGSGITATARRRWTALRAQELAGLFVDAALARSAPVLRLSAERDARNAAALQALREDLA